jgi:GT2 family glycosyltransferase
MFSIVIVYNNTDILKNWILESLKNQTVQYELILLDNSDNKYLSASHALNSGLKIATQKYLMCIHQDVTLIGRDFLEKTESMLNKLDCLGLAGVAGMSDRSIEYNNNMRNIILQGHPFAETWGNKIDNPEEVQTIDECLMIIPFNIYKNVKFDENTCDDWHLYGVDFSLTVNKLGFKVYTLPLQIHHRSKGESAVIPTSTIQRIIHGRSKGYINTLSKILKKHRGYRKEIFTTCGAWYTDYPIAFQKFAHFIKRLYLLFNK